MKKTCASLLLVAAADLLAMVSSAHADSASVCGGVGLGYTVPDQVNMNAEPVPKSLIPLQDQNKFDCTSWATFAALNWPAAPVGRGLPNPLEPIDGKSSRGPTWLTMWSPEELFLANAENPCPAFTPLSDYDPKKPLPLSFQTSCFSTHPKGGSDASAAPRLRSIAKNTLHGKRGLDVLESLGKNEVSAFLAAKPTTQGVSTTSEKLPADIFQAFTSSWLTDQNGNVVLYQVLLSQDYVFSVVQNKWYDALIQNADSAIQFRSGNGDSDGKATGAMEIKVAWRVLTSSDSASRYINTVATVDDVRRDPVTAKAISPTSGSPTGVFLTCTEDNDNKSWTASCNRTVGVVGFHISHKFDLTPQWMWSTFEHIDNAPIAGTTPAQSSYSFYNPSCTPPTEYPNACVVNQQPASANIPPTVPVQVERVIPAHGMVTRPSMEVTNYWWNKLPADSVLRNYMLVSTQWPSVPRDGVTGDPFPPTLANTTIETYMQDTAQGTCIGCHALARTPNNAYPTDFSFMMNAATVPPSAAK